jgi:NDP-sugar pyrophosphorylase family protein
MTAVMPMAGRGSRFTSAGYTVPKFLVEVKGKTLLQYSLESLPLDIFDQVIFIGLAEHERDYAVTGVISSILGKIPFRWIGLEEVTRGQAETVLACEAMVKPAEDLVIYNIDTYFQSETLRSLLRSEGRHDGVIGYIKDDAPKWSFALPDPETGFVVKTAEKDPISDNALTGLYHFTRAKDFFDIARYQIAANLTTKNEFYIAPMYNQLIASGKKYVLDYAGVFAALGTPEDVETFAKQG